ncbi:hypothetical protein FRB96_009217 [Tulasnella sp. 330]|nr:hypothetical protein FRB96_009217 [Tulasnella sp. 330]
MSTIEQDPSIETSSREPALNQEPEESSGKTGLGTARFWLVFGSLMMATFVAALDVTAVSTALPTIVFKLHGSGMAQIFGRKPVLLGFLIFFLGGSAICGATTNLNMLIAGRTVQGVGCGGILSLTEIIIADLVPLSKERVLETDAMDLNHVSGLYMGLIGMVWAAAGPPVAIAFARVTIFLRVRAPQDTFSNKMKRMDWTGNFLVVSTTTATIIGRTWGGVRYPWSSWHVLVPLVLGFVGLAGFLVYEANFPVEPVVSWKLLANRATLAGYLVTFFIASLPPAPHYVPTYLQAVKGESAIRSGVVFLATAATIAPGAIICGASVTILKIYRPQNMIGYIGYQIIGGIGLGILYPVVQFPVLASPPLSETAHALALFTFIRQFATTWGITIGSTIPQNGLTKNLPHSVITEVSATTSGSVHNEIAYVIIPLISGLQEPLKTQTQVAFATSLRLIWHVLLGVCGLGLLSVLLMKEIPMQEVNSDEFGMKDKKVKGEKAVELDEKTMTTVASSVLWGAVVYCGGGSFGLRSQLTGLVMQRPCYPRIELSHPSN